MNHLTTHLAVRAFLSFMSPTVAHAEDWSGTTTWQYPPIGSVTNTANGVVTNSNPDHFIVDKSQWYKLYDYPAADNCVRPEPPVLHCAPGYEAACQQRDHGTDGLRR